MPSRSARRAKELVGYCCSHAAPASATGPADLFGPADAEPSIATELLDRAMIERPPTFGRIELRAKVVGDYVGEVGAELIAQRGLFGRVVEIHGGVCSLARARRLVAASGHN